jgi:hypothetical protein
MNNKKGTYSDPASRTRWASDPDKSVSYEFDFKGQLVTPGMQLKVRNERVNHTFICLVTTISTGKTWLETITPEGYRSPRIENIMSVVGVKRSYKKKVAAQ